jgi:hypothetical protein
MGRFIPGFLAILSLALCLLFPILRFLGRISEERYKLGLLFASISWLLFASVWAARKKRKRNP